MLPVKPLLSEAIVVRHEGLLVGPITSGEVFAWEPDEPCAREFVIVQRVDNGTIWTWDMDYARLVWNTEGRFREACCRTRFNFFPSDPSPLDVAFRSRAKP